MANALECETKSCFLVFRAFNERWLPDHLNYLDFLFENRSPECVAARFGRLSASICHVHLIFKNADRLIPDPTQQLSLYLVGSLMLLASIEHLFLMFPVNEAALMALGSR